MEPALEPVFVGRQPIYDRHLTVSAYELLFRSKGMDSATFADGDQASAQVIINTFLEIGLEPIVGAHRAFINLSRGFLLSERWRLLPKERVVLEVLEDVGAGAEVVKTLAGAAASGYTIALDDFVFEEGLAELLTHAHILKFDVRALGPERLREQVLKVQRWDLRLLAEKVETQEEFALCRQLGFDYFQGYFLCRPQTISGQRLPTERVATLRLVAELQDPDVEIKRLEEIIRVNLSLSYKILRCVNSAHHGIPRRVESIREAVILLGLERIKMWTSLIMLAGLTEKPRAILTAAMVRARMCEQLGALIDERGRHKFFTAGMFSLLDVLLERPLSEVLTLLPLSPAITEALLERRGPIGQALLCALAYERAAWDEVRFEDVPAEVIRDIYLESLQFAAALERL